MESSVDFGNRQSVQLAAVDNFDSRRRRRGEQHAEHGGWSDELEREGFYDGSVLRIALYLLLISTFFAADTIWAELKESNSQLAATFSKLDDLAENDEEVYAAEIEKLSKISSAQVGRL